MSKAIKRLCNDKILLLIVLGKDIKTKNITKRGNKCRNNRQAGNFTRSKQDIFLIRNKESIGGYLSPVAFHYFMRRVHIERESSNTSDSHQNTDDDVIPRRLREDVENISLHSFYG